jgi:predicted dehydrogenase
MRHDIDIHAISSPLRAWLGKQSTMNRRDFLQAAAASGFSFASAMGAVEIRAEVQKDEPSGPPVTVAVIGLGEQGRAILASLAKLGPGKAPIAAICDNYKSPILQKRAAEFAPTATMYDDYKRVLDDKKVQAVFVATPSHKHKAIVLDALQAGKHVYCEAPLATDLDEAKAIAKAGMEAKTFLMPGLQVRSNAQARHVGKFIKVKDIGTIVQGRAQWNQRQTWRRAGTTPEREKEMNWRLYNETSSGLIGEIGIHQIDLASRYLNALPVAVTGFSALKVNRLPNNGQDFKDDRTVPTLVQCIVEYPDGIPYAYEASLHSSFENAKNEGYEVFSATGATILIRDQRAWMFKEADANALGWEGFARTDSMSVGKPQDGTGEKIGEGIALVADATKQIARGKKPGEIGTDVSKTSLYQAVEAFVIAASTDKKPDVGPLEGYQATVVAHKCNDAAVSRSRIEFQPDAFAL